MDVVGRSMASRQKSRDPASPAAALPLSTYHVFLDLGDRSDRHAGAEGRSVTEGGQESHDPRSMGSELLEQLDHLLVGPARPPGEVPGNLVLVVKVPTDTASVSP